MKNSIVRHDSDRGFFIDTDILHDIYFNDDRELAELVDQRSETIIVAGGIFKPQRWEGLDVSIRPTISRETPFELLFIFSPRSLPDEQPTTLSLTAEVGYWLYHIEQNGVVREGTLKPSELKKFLGAVKDQERKRNRAIRKQNRN